MGSNLDIEDVCHGHPLAQEQLTALMEDNARLRAENEGLRNYLRMIEHANALKQAIEPHAALHGEGEKW